jgi:DNA-binding response OmpR family regulator
MSAEAYRFVRLALGDPEPGFCKTVTSALFPLGLRDVSTCSDGEGMRTAAAQTVDVIVCDTHLRGLDFPVFVQDIRQGRLGSNPFVVMIATVRDEGEAKSEGIPRSGIDEMLAKPLNPLMLVRRVNQLSRERQNFVMTPGYVGPSRRAARRNDGSDDNLVAVPNTLRAKIVEKATTDSAVATVEAAKAGLDKEKALSGLRVMARMTRQLINLQDRNAAVDDCRAVLHALGRMAKEVAAQHEAAGANHVSPIADRIGKLAARAQAAPAGPSKAELHLLLQLSEATFAVFAPRPGTVELDTVAALPEVVAVVDGYLARG